jgi:hypothetical protein
VTTDDIKTVDGTDETHIGIFRANGVQKISDGRQYRAFSMPRASYEAFEQPMRWWRGILWARPKIGHQENSLGPLPHLGSTDHV